MKNLFLLGLQMAIVSSKPLSVVKELSLDNSTIASLLTEFMFLTGILTIPNVTRKGALNMIKKYGNRSHCNVTSLSSEENFCFMRQSYCSQSFHRNSTNQPCTDIGYWKRNYRNIISADNHSIWNLKRLLDNSIYATFSFNPQYL